MMMMMMRKFLIYAIAMVLFLSCKAQKIEQELIQGTFYKLNKDRHFSSSYTLELHSDGSFLLQEKLHEANPQCQGRWTIEDNKFVVLKCDDVKDVTETLTNGYMNKREHKLLIISRNKVKYNDVVLKRKKA
jgi:hypothetical protein